MTFIDPANATPGLPRPVVIGTAHYVDAEGMPRTAPIYEPAPATNGQRIQAEDIDPSWTLVREEPIVPPADVVTVDELRAQVERLATGLALVDGTTIAGLRSDIQQAALPIVPENQ